MSLTQMSRRSNIPVSTIYEKLKNYEKGLLRKNTALIDFTKIGYSTRARMLMKAKNGEVQKLKEHLLLSPFLNELYKVNNGYDFMAEFIFRSLKETEDYIGSLREAFELEKEQVIYLIDELGKEEFMSKASPVLLGQ